MNSENIDFYVPNNRDWWCKYCCGNSDIQYCPLSGFPRCNKCNSIIIERGDSWYDSKTISPKIYMWKVIDKYYSNHRQLQIGYIYFKVAGMNIKVEKAFRQINCNLKRSNSLNVHYKLYKLLQLSEENCDISDFKICLKRAKTLKNYDMIWKQICEINKWEFKKSDWNEKTEN